MSKDRRLAYLEKAIESSRHTLLLCQDAIDRLMGDSDVLHDEDNSIEARAMRMIVRTLKEIGEIEEHD